MTLKSAKPPTEHFNEIEEHTLNLQGKTHMLLMCQKL